ncbi:MAG: glycosyltransferase, partial [Patescibacteria group bacterium]
MVETQNFASLQKSMKKILYIITQAEFGGAQRYVYDLATNLSYPSSPPLTKGRNNEEGDFEIAVAIGETRSQNLESSREGGAHPAVAGNPKPDDLATRLRAKNIRVIQLKHLMREINIWDDLAAVCEIRKLIKKEKPDIIHLNSTKAGFIGSLAVWLSTPPHLPLLRGGQLRRPRLIYTIHGWIFNEPLPAWRK